MKVKCVRACKENSKYCGYHKPKDNEPVIIDYNQVQDITVRPNTIEDRMMRIPVNKRFKCIEKAVEMVINNVSLDSNISKKGIPGLMICGKGGIGKTHLVVETLKKHNLVLGEHWWKNSGKISAFGVYQLLYEHKDGGIIVLDDSDLWNNKEGMNVLKAALDSYNERIVSWNTRGADLADLPRSFVTKASVIFITNRSEKEIPQPIKDRCIYVPLKLTREEVFERMDEIIPNIQPEIEIDIKKEVLEFLKEIFRDNNNDLSLRTLLSAIKWRLNHPNDWREYVQIFV